MLWFLIQTFFLTHISIPLCNAGWECLCGDLWNFLCGVILCSKLLFLLQTGVLIFSLQETLRPSDWNHMRVLSWKTNPAPCKIVSDDLWTLVGFNLESVASGQGSRHILIGFITPLAQHFHCGGGDCPCNYSKQDQNCVYTYQEKIKQVWGIIFCAKIKKSLSVLVELIPVYPLQTSSNTQSMNPPSRSRNWPFIAVLRIHWVENSRGGGMCVCSRRCKAFK